MKGKFDHSKEIIIQPRCRIDNYKPHSGMFNSRNQQNGAWIITPFKLSDRNYSILINRGWVPKYRMDKEKRKDTLIEDEVTITGVLRLSEKVTKCFIELDFSVDSTNFESFSCREPSSQ